MFTPIDINTLTPALAIHPGEILKDELDARQITQKEFSLLIGMAPTQLNEVIKGKRNITPELALLIGKALSMDASIWNNLQAGYDLDKAKIMQRTQQRFLALDSWNSIKNWIPVKFFKKERLVSGDPVMDLPIVKEIYKVAHCDEIIAKYSEPRYALHRKSKNLETDKINLLGWEQLVMYNAEQQKVQKFDVRRMDELIEELKTVFSKNKKTIHLSQQVLARYGIKLVMQTPPEKCAVDGISFWSNGNPAIGLSLRHKRIDNFAFTLLHELGHVYLHLTSDNEAQFIDMEEPVKNDKEKEADTFALEQLIDNETWKDFLLDCNKPLDEDFISFAKKHKLHPAIVYGRYCHDKNKYNMRTSIDKQLN